MLANPELDEEHLRFVKTASRHVAQGDQARLHLRVIRKVLQEPVTSEEREESARVPISVRHDLAVLMHATIYAVAELQPMWKGSLLRALAKGSKKVDRSPERTATALEAALDDRMMRAA